MQALDEGIHLPQNCVTIAFFHNPNGNPGINSPCLKREVGGNEAERSYRHSLWNGISRHEDCIGPDGCIVFQNHVACDEMIFDISNAAWENGHDIVYKIVTSTPDFDTR